MTVNSTEPIGEMTDTIDASLLAKLREDGRASTAEILDADDVPLPQLKRPAESPSTLDLHAHLERLERDGVIAGYTVRLGPRPEFGAVRAHVMIKVGAKEARAVIAALTAVSQVRLLHSVSGEVDLIAVAATETVAEMDQVIDRIGALPGVERTTSSIILSTKFER